MPLKKDPFELHNDFLGYTFRASSRREMRVIQCVARRLWRASFLYYGKFFVSFLPAISDKAGREIRELLLHDPFAPFFCRELLCYYGSFRPLAPLPYSRSRGASA